ncbi:MAG: DUF86 domain-containing protein [Candidatus Lokiarchaeota archaeon]|nr:DUF86 domain-containing protein [Candidatus Lokiarchaeota archaeon]
MDQLRLKRYWDKIDYIIQNVQSLNDDPQSEMEKKAIFYSIQTSIESAMDLIAMFLKDTGNEIGDNYENIETMVKLGRINKKQAENLKKSNGLRNVLVHRYNGVDEKLVIESINEVKEILYILIKKIEGFLDEST